MATAAPKTRRTQRQRSAETTQRLLAALVDLIAEKGFQRTTAAEIGERAGYSRSMVSVQYGSKQALLRSLLQSEYQANMLRAATPASTGLGQLFDEIDTIRAQSRENPNQLRAFFVLCFETVGPVADLRQWMSDWLDEYQAETAAAIRRGQQDGSIRVELDPDLEAQQIVDFRVAWAFRWALRPDTIDYDAELGTWKDRLTAALAPEHHGH
jgi:AcrR family transcriptional regulator